MVVETTYYEILQVEATADEAELRKAYRKQAIKLHPDKNGNDPKAAEKFQELGEAYGVLSNPESRRIYDEFGVEGMKKQQQVAEQDINPSEFFELVFGGVAFKEWIGEIAVMDDLTKSAEVLGLDEEEEEEANEAEAAKKAVGAGATNTVEAGGVPKHSANKSHTSGKPDSPGRSSSSDPASLSSNLDSLTLVDQASQDASSGNSKPQHRMSSQELKRKKKQKITKEQREEVLRIHEESKRTQLKRIEQLSTKLLQRIETYRTASLSNPEAIQRFTAKLRDELNDMKVESFGIQLIHLIGKIYTSQAKAVISSSKTFGVSKLYTSMKSSGETMRNGYSIVKTALEAQEASEKVMAEHEEFEIRVEMLGYEPTPEELAAQEERMRFVTGKVLATAWSLVKFEVTNVLKKVCERVLSEKGLAKKERVARANALLAIGREFMATQRSKEEEDDARIFEEMMADAKVKKDNSKKRTAESKHNHHVFGGKR
ncbi:uncharacterized protein LODBEIA_P40200 [Lodderomyces beijingensis]|uniref:J domain-containing protein n=1 Tax=Lodderomyces beijingensis TaxID=1775926 RepID=A0ABP0ZS82_9ASCO